MKWMKVLAVALAAVVVVLPALAQPNEAQAVLLADAELSEEELELAVVLAAVVVAFPALAQLSEAQTVPIPEGDVLADNDLAAIDGELGKRRDPFLGGGGLWWSPSFFGDRVMLICPEKQLVAQSVPQNVQIAQQLREFAQWLATRSVQLVQQVGVQATQHPAVRDTILGMAFRITGEAIRAKLENRSLTLTDVGFGLLWGGLSGAGAHWIGRGLEKLGRR